MFGEPAQLGGLLAAQLLREARFEPSSHLQPVPLGDIARALDIDSIGRPEAHSPFRPEGALWEAGGARQSLFADVRAEIAAKGARGRFTLAHELAHRWATVRLSPEETAGWTAEIGLLSWTGSRVV